MCVGDDAMMVDMFGNKLWVVAIKKCSIDVGECWPKKVNIRCARNKCQAAVGVVSFCWRGEIVGSMEKAASR